MPGSRMLLKCAVCKSDYKIELAYDWSHTDAMHILESVHETPCFNCFRKSLVPYTSGNVIVNGLFDAD